MPGIRDDGGSSTRGQFAPPPHADALAEAEFILRRAGADLIAAHVETTRLWVCGR